MIQSLDVLKDIVTEQCEEIDLSISSLIKAKTSFKILLL